MLKHPLLAACILSLSPLLVCSHSPAQIISWEASSGLLPSDSSLPAEQRFHLRGELSYVSLKNGIMHISDSGPTGIAFVKTNNDPVGPIPAIGAKDEWVLQVTLRMNSHQREEYDFGAAIGLDEARNVRLAISRDRVGFGSRKGWLDDLSYPLNTTESFHTYLVVKRQGVVQLFIDGKVDPVLSVSYDRFNKSVYPRTLYLVSTSSPGVADFDVLSFKANLSGPAFLGTPSSQESINHTEQPVHAFTMLNLGKYANWNIRDNYKDIPTGEQVILAGIPFDMSTGKGYRAPYSGESQQEDTIRFDGLDIARPESVYLLVNTAHGIPDTKVAEIALHMRSGLSFTYSLVVGKQIRCYMKGGHDPDITVDEHCTEVFQGKDVDSGLPLRIDILQIEVPAHYQDEILNSIEIKLLPGPRRGGILLMHSAPTIRSQSSASVLPGQPTTRAATQPARLPVPPQDAQKISETKIKSLFQEEYSRDSASERQAFARRLIGIAVETKDNSTDRFVLLREARELATQSGDLSTALQALDIMAKGYEIDLLQARSKVFESIDFPNSDGYKKLIGHVEQTVDQAIDDDRYDIALELVNLGIRIARKINYRRLLSVLVDRREEVEGQQKLYDAIQHSINALEEDPNSVDANLAVGKHWCFTKAHWAEGLPMLAKGPQGDLRDLVQKEISQPTSVDAQTALGDQWARFAESTDDDVEKDGAYQRALHWYKRALSQVSGISKVEIEHSIQEVSRHLNFALRFGGDDTVRIPPSRKYQKLSNATIEFWCQIPVGTSTNRILDQINVGRGRTTKGRWLLDVTGKGTIRLYARTPCLRDVYGKKIVSDGKWHHVAVVNDKGEISIYVDGRFDRQGTLGVVLSSAAPLYLGSRANVEQFMTGTLDEVRLWNVARSAKDIRSNYRHKIDPKTPGLIGDWSFDEETEDQTVYDRSDSGNHGTLGGSVKVADDDPKRVKSTVPFVRER